MVIIIILKIIYYTLSSGFQTTYSHNILLLFFFFKVILNPSLLVLDSCRLINNKKIIQPAPQKKTKLFWFCLQDTIFRPLDSESKQTANDVLNKTACLSIGRRFIFYFHQFFNVAKFIDYNFNMPFPLFFLNFIFVLPGHYCCWWNIYVTCI